MTLRGSAIGLSAALALAGCMASTDGIPQTSTRIAFLPEGQQLKARYDETPSCGDLAAVYRDRGWPMGDGVDTIREIDRRVRRQFDYRTERVDRWTPMAAPVLAGKRISGDCDDLSSTVVMLARCAGVPDSRLGFLITRTPFSPRANHMVGMFTDTGGQTWIIGDTTGRMRPVNESLQTLEYWTYLDRMENWNMSPSATASAAILPAEE